MVRKSYESALQRYQKLLPFEERLQTDEDSSSAFDEYIEMEVKNGDPARIQCLYERAIAVHCLNEQLWNSYVCWLDEKLKVHEVFISIICKFRLNKRRLII